MGLNGEYCECLDKFCTGAALTHTLPVTGSPYFPPDPVSPPASDGFITLRRVTICIIDTFHNSLGVMEFVRAPDIEQSLSFQIAGATRQYVVLHPGSPLSSRPTFKGRSLSEKSTHFLTASKHARHFESHQSSLCPRFCAVGLICAQLSVITLCNCRSGAEACLVSRIQMQK